MITWNFLLCILSVPFGTRAEAEAEEGLAAVASALATVQPQGEEGALPVFVVGSEGTAGCCEGGNVSHSLGLARRLQAKRAMRGELFFFFAQRFENAFCAGRLRNAPGGQPL